MIVDIADEAKALADIWKALGTRSIAWEIENTNLSGTCKMEYCVQGEGNRIGTWDDIPPQECEECGTDGDAFSNNNGAVVYSFPISEAGPDGNYLGYLVVGWYDGLSAAQYYLACFPKQDALQVADNLGNNAFECISITGAPSQLINYYGVNISVQPGFDPFKISFSVSTSDDPVSDEQNLSSSTTPRVLTEPTLNGFTMAQLADRHDALAKVLLERGKKLRGE